MLTTEGIIDWNAVISDLKNISGSIRHVDQTIDHKKTNLKTYKEIIDAGLIPYEFARLPFVEMVKNYYDNNLDFAAIGFENYYPNLDQYLLDSHFSKTIVEKIEILLNLKVQECWISCVEPNCTIPFHKDEFDDELKWVTLENKTLVRYTVFIDDPIPDQIFIVGDQRFENIPKHRIVKWPSIKELHSLQNHSDKPNFLFHFLGFVLPTS
jgi:hypothetical protein